MSESGSAQPGPREDHDPWAPPERRVPLGKGGDGERPAAPPVMPPAVPAAVPPPRPEGGVPPVPPAPTGPGTPSDYRPAYGAYGAYAGPPPVPAQGSPYPPGYGPIPPSPYGPNYPGAPYGQLWAAPPQVPNNGFGTAALVLGIVGVVLSFTMVFGIVLGVLAVVFGAIGRAKVTKGEAANRGSATAGIVLGSLALLLSVLMIVLVAIAPDSERHRSHDDYDDDPGGTYRTSVSAPSVPVPASR